MAAVVGGNGGSVGGSGVVPVTVAAVQQLTSQVHLLVMQVVEVVVVLVQDMVFHMIKVQQVHQEAVVTGVHQVMDQVMVAQQIKVVAVVVGGSMGFVVVVLTQAALGGSGVVIVRYKYQSG